MRKCHCKGVLKYEDRGGNYICAGVNKQGGSKYRKDTIWLCMSGLWSDTKIEITPYEAVLIISALSTCLGDSNAYSKNKKLKTY